MAFNHSTAEPADEEYPEQGDIAGQANALHGRSIESDVNCYNFDWAMLMIISTIRCNCLNKFHACMEDSPSNAEKQCRDTMHCVSPCKWFGLHGPDHQTCNIAHALINLLQLLRIWNTTERALRNCGASHKNMRSSTNPVPTTSHSKPKNWSAVLERVLWNRWSYVLTSGSSTHEKRENCCAYEMTLHTCTVDSYACTCQPPKRAWPHENLPLPLPCIRYTLVVWAM